MRPIVIAGREYPELEDLVAELGSRGRAWQLDNPGQASPADAFMGLPPEQTRLVEEAATALMRTATHPGELRIAMHLGEGPYAPYYAAVLDRLDGAATADAALREELLTSVAWVTVVRDPELRSRARSLFEREKRPDLLLTLLSLDDPDGDLLDVLDRAVESRTLSPELAGAIGFTVAKRAPQSLGRAARALAAQPTPTCARFLERALRANPAEVSGLRAQLVELLGLQ